MDRDTFVTEVYVMADDDCQAQQIDWPVQPGPRPSLSVAAVISLALASRWQRFASDQDFYRDATRHLQRAVPRLPANSQLNRRVRAATPWLIGFGQPVVAPLQARACPYPTLDTLGCATRHRKRRGAGWLAGEADVGDCNRLGGDEGLNLLLSNTPDGVITGFGLAPASTKEQPYAEVFLALRARLAASVALHNVCIWLNVQRGRPKLAFADLLDWQPPISHQAFQSLSICPHIPA